MNNQLAFMIEATEGAVSKSLFLPHSCASPALNASCNARPLSADHGDELRVTAKLNGTRALRGAGGLAPVNVTIRLCFSKPSTADRPWRKPSDVIDKDKSCPHVLATLPVNGEGVYSATWKVPKNAPRATWYAQAYVSCANSTAAEAAKSHDKMAATVIGAAHAKRADAPPPVICAVSSTKGANFFATAPILSVPTGMTVAAGICSAIAPLFLALFFIKERAMKKSA